MALDGLFGIKRGASAPQDEDSIAPARWINAVGRGRMRLSTLIALRWRGIFGQVLVLFVTGAVFGVDLPWAWCAPLVALSLALNAALVWIERRRRQLTSWQYAALLGIDTLQLTVLLFVTGGLANPFAVLILAPVVLAAATLPTTLVLAEVVGALFCVITLSLWSWPLPAPLSDTIAVTPAYEVAATVALITAIAFTASYAWRASKEAEQMEVALSLTEQVLAREQRLSALGALAAAAAHELGTPLATIQIVSRELARGATDPALKEDAELLIEQAERCREILRRLAETPETRDPVHARLSLSQFLNEAVEPHQNGPIRVEAVISGPPGMDAPEIRRLPEMLHAFTTLIENATDFAAAEVLVRAHFDSGAISVQVQDDGPGFSADVLGRLGDPYVTTRPQGEGSRSGHAGLGLGFFIAKTLLEKTGAAVTYQNARRGGAIVAARWPRSVLEAPAPREF